MISGAGEVQAASSSKLAAAARKGVSGRLVAEAMDGVQWPPARTQDARIIGPAMVNNGWTASVVDRAAAPEPRA